MTAALLLALTACGGGSDGDGGGSDTSAADAAAEIQGSVDSVTKVVEITEDNDPNGDIGRPGKYTEASTIYDSRVECTEDLDITCGAKIEVWEDEDAAKARSDFIQSALEATQILGSEYHYIDGGMLLRVSGELKPSEAEEYEAAFK